MAVSSPKVPVFCIVRGRWYRTTDLFDNRDWLVKTYKDWFVPGAGSATVPLVESGPKPPNTGGGGGPVSDPRVDGLIARIVALETAGGGGADPRVDGLIARVGEVETAAGKATEKAEKAAVAASAAASEAGNAKTTAEQASVTAGQAKSKADEVSVALGAVKSQAGSAEAKATAAETKAVGATNTARQAYFSATSASQTANAAKSITDRLATLDLPGTYPKMQTDVQLAKQNADNAQIIATGVSRKVDEHDQKIQELTRRVDGMATTGPSTSTLEWVQSISMNRGQTMDIAELPEGLLYFKPRDGGSANLTINGTYVGVPLEGMLATCHEGALVPHRNGSSNYPHYAFTGKMQNGSNSLIDIHVYGIR